VTGSIDGGVGDHGPAGRGPQPAGPAATAGRASGPDARRARDPGEAAGAARRWWDAEADAYQAEHGAFLGDARLVWGPEGLDEEAAGLLGPRDALRGRSVLEVGCGAGHGARWLVAQGARAVGLDLSAGQLAHARRLDRVTGLTVPVVQADAVHLPFATGCFDLVVSAYGALPFVADLLPVHREVARVLGPSGRWVFAVPHPVRWAFPDVPGPEGLTATHSYFDRTPYVEADADGRLSYVEHHRTLGDHVRALVSAGFGLLDLVEPEWPDGHDGVWGGWSPLRGRLLPGTAVFVAERR
jgi:SAM-dependent methyltransferase